MTPIHTISKAERDLLATSIVGPETRELLVRIVKEHDIMHRHLSRQQPDSPVHAGGFVYQSEQTGKWIAGISVSFPEDVDDLGENGWTVNAIEATRVAAIRKLYMMLAVLSDPASKA